ncbi:hypothetical protein [Streptomyces sp. CAI-85]|uniref:hypothetical protein n=1 Tax=Streptomyces sp. CAI-85 TaxID=1472662 RepID=UPI0015872E8E|nr:hypothetical protein [Streptomyces sp. CAI-85]NUV64992.1 hypothetical protein [Streptomyces sp. CAI-85]
MPVDAAPVLAALATLIDAQLDDPDDYALVLEEAAELFDAEQDWTALVPPATT